MGIVQRQGLKNSISLYIGIVIGFVSRVVIFPRALDPEQIGLIINMVLIGQTFAQIGSWGFPNIIVRYFPFFEDKAKQHNGLLAFSLLIATIIFIILSIPFLFLSFRTRCYHIRGLCCY